jgi:hypothetical protein
MIAREKAIIPSAGRSRLNVDIARGWYIAKKRLPPDVGDYTKLMGF